MKNIFLTKCLIVFFISNFCNGQITANLSFGIDELLNNSHEYNGKSICLFTNSGAIDKNALNSVEILQEKFDLQIVVHLDKKDSVNINFDKEELYFYNLTNEDLLEIIKDIDVVFIDFQDLGLRSTSYTIYLSKIIYACGLSRTPIIVLDRPNPLGGSIVSGNIPQKSLANPFEMISIPYRHGMTIGELARLLNEEYHHNAKLKIIPMDNWSGEEWTYTNLQWKYLPPNINSYDKLKYFSISNLLAPGNMFENGQESDREHQILAHPNIEDASDLVFELKALKLPGVEFFPAVTVPSNGLFKGKICNGFSFKITDSGTYDPWNIAIESAKVIKRMYPDIVFDLKGNNRIDFDHTVGNGAATNITLEDGSWWHLQWIDYSHTQRGYFSAGDGYVISTNSTGEIDAALYDSWAQQWTGGPLAQ